jgi:hypothetical protein
MLILIHELSAFVICTLTYRAMKKCHPYKLCFVASVSIEMPKLVYATFFFCDKVGCIRSTVRAGAPAPSAENKLKAQAKSKNSIHKIQTVYKHFYVHILSHYIARFSEQEPKNVTEEVVCAWKAVVLPLLLSEYHPKDILPCRRVMIVFQSSLR